MHGRVESLGSLEQGALRTRSLRLAGNVRELKNALERSVVMARGEESRSHDLPAKCTGLPLTSRDLRNVDGNDRPRFS